MVALAALLLPPLPGVERAGPGVRREDLKTGGADLGFLPDPDARPVQRGAGAGAPHFGVDVEVEELVALEAGAGDREADQVVGTDRAQHGVVALRDGPPGAHPLPFQLLGAAVRLGRQMALVVRRPGPGMDLADGVQVRQEGGPDRDARVPHGYRYARHSHRVPR